MNFEPIPIKCRTLETLRAQETSFIATRLWRRAWSSIQNFHSYDERKQNRRTASTLNLSPESIWIDPSLSHKNLCILPIHNPRPLCLHSYLHPLTPIIGITASGIPGPTDTLPCQCVISHVRCGFDGAGAVEQGADIGGDP